MSCTWGGWGDVQGGRGGRGGKRGVGQRSVKHPDFFIGGKRRGKVKKVCFFGMKKALI